MGEEKVYSVFILDFERGKVFRLKVDAAIAEESEALEEFLFDKMGFSESNCQWMVTLDCEVYGEEEV